MAKFEKGEITPQTPRDEMVRDIEEKAEIVENITHHTKAIEGRIEKRRAQIQRIREQQIPKWQARAERGDATDKDIARHKVAELEAKILKFENDIRRAAEGQEDLAEIGDEMEEGISTTFRDIQRRLH